MAAKRGQHGNHARGSDNGNWKGGRTIASNGYVLLRLPGHHLADVRGYVYEHRLVAEQKLCRELRKGDRMIKQKHVEVYLDRGGKRFRYRLLSARGENLANAGQSYASRGGARRAARREHPGVPIIST